MCVLTRRPCLGLEAADVKKQREAMARGVTRLWHLRGTDLPRELTAFAEPTERCAATAALPWHYRSVTVALP